MGELVLVDRKIELARHEEATFQLYLSMFEQYKKGNIAIARVNSCFGTMIAAPTSGWRVIGITNDALDLFADSNFSGRVKGIQRAHLINRFDTVKVLFDRNQPMGKTDLFETWRKNDRTVLARKSQNKGIVNECKKYFDNPDGEYFKNMAVGYQFRKGIEGELLRAVWERHRTAKGG